MNQLKFEIEKFAKHCFNYERTLLDTIDLRNDFELFIILAVI